MIKLKTLLNIIMAKNNYKNKRILCQIMLIKMNQVRRLKNYNN